MARVIGVAATVVIVGCLGGLGGSSAVPAAACGPLVRWKMPATTLVDRTANDSRSLDVLTTQARLDAVVLAAEAYCRENNGVYPMRLAQMRSLPPSIARCAIDSTDTVDAWERQMRYAVVEGRMTASSAGPDGIFATPDDIGLPSAADHLSELFVIDQECR